MIQFLPSLLFRENSEQFKESDLEKDTLYLETAEIKLKSLIVFGN